MSLVRYFGDIQVSIREQNNEFWIQGEDICKALEYADPYTSESRIFSRNQSLLENYILISQNEKSLNRRFYNEIGTSLLIMKSGTPKAEELQIWMAKTLQTLRKGQKLSPGEFLVEAANKLLSLEQQGEVILIKLEETNERIEVLEDKILPDEKMISEQQAHVIKDHVSTIAFALNSEKPRFGHVYGQFYKEFQIGSYLRLPLSKYNSALDYLKEWIRTLTPKFQQRLRFE